MPRKRTKTPSIPDDARVQRSVQALREALLQLLETKPLDQIAIKEITEQAGLSYPTFFRRFASKQELLEDIATSEVRNLLVRSYPPADNGSEFDLAMIVCRYIHDNRKLWRRLLTGGAADAMRTEFMQVSRQFAATRPRVNPWIPMDLAVPFVASGAFELFAWWMREAEEYPLENVVRLFDLLVVEPTARPREVTLPIPFP